MRLEFLLQFIVPLTFLAIWALTSLLNRDAQPLPPRPGAGRGPGGGPGRVGAGGGSRRRLGASWRDPLAGPAVVLGGGRSRRRDGPRRLRRAGPAPIPTRAVDEGIVIIESETRGAQGRRRSRPRRRRRCPGGAGTARRRAGRRRAPARRPPPRQADRAGTAPGPDRPDRPVAGPEAGKPLEIVPLSTPMAPISSAPLTSASSRPPPRSPAPPPRRTIRPSPSTTSAPCSPPPSGSARSRCSASCSSRPSRSAHRGGLADGGPVARGMPDRRLPEPHTMAQLIVTRSRRLSGRLRAFAS